ncbi:MAG: fused MFS/spermidine synthase [Oligoflexia bacterium]|nr:fused MFS/spermidine synthase [Oligoflexia bacterium]
MLKKIALILFLFSGMTGLVYESIWIRVLSLGVGATSTSMSIVLSIFFFGLSIGSFIASKYAERINNPLLFYGITEGFIGLYTPFLIYILINFHKILAFLPLNGSFSPLGIFSKFFIVFILLAPPTILMGLTLPLLVKFFTKDTHNIGKNVSFLYAINTFGGLTGAILGSFIFIPKLGIIFANHLMAILNISCFLITFYYCKKYFPSEKIFVFSNTNVKNKYKHAYKDNISTPIEATSTNTTIVASCFIIGFASITFEVVWNKYLGIFFGTNIYGLGIILSLYLLGIGLGSSLLSFFYNKIKKVSEVFIYLLFAALLFSLLASYLLNLAPLMATVFGYYLENIFSLLIIKIFITVIVLILPTLSFGAILPLAISMVSASAKDAPKVTGQIYAWNTIGAILGSYLSGIVLIPNFDSGNTIKIALLSIVVAIIAVTYFTLKEKRKKWIQIAIAILIAILVLYKADIDFKNIIKSAYNQSIGKQLELSDLLKYYHNDYEDFKLIIEGKTGVISLSHDPQDGTYYKNFYRLKTNGLNESVYNIYDLNTLPKYEALLGLLSYLFVRDPQNAFVVGYGGGYTVNFLTTTDLKNVYVAELEEGIIEASNFVHKNNNPILKRKNLNLEIEDARYVLNIGKKGALDIIVSQPSHSWLSGVANLFTEEFFNIVKSNLSEKGVFSQWLNLYNLNEPVLKSILKTFFTVFPYGAVFTDLKDQEMIMVGSKRPLTLNIQKLKMMTKNHIFESMLSGIPFNDPYNALTNYSLSRDEIINITKDANLNTDVNAYAEVMQSALFYSKDKYNEYPQTFLSNNFSGDFSFILKKEIAGSDDFIFKMLSAYKNNGKFDKFHLLLQKLENGTVVKKDRNVIRMKELGELYYSVERYASAEKILKEAWITSRTSEILYLLVATLQSSKKYSEALELIDKNPSLSNESINCYKASMLFESFKWESFKSYMKYMKILNYNEKSTYPTYVNKCGIYFYKLLGYYYYLNYDYNNALKQFAKYYEQYTTDERVLSLIVSSYLALNDSKNALYFAEILKHTVETKKKNTQSLSQYYFSKNLKEDSFVLKSLE